MTTTAIPIAKRASQFVRVAGLVFCDLAMAAAYAKVRS